MKIFSKLLPLFVIVSIIELMLLIEIGKYIGALQTIALVLLTGALGAMLVQAEGLRIWQQLQAELLNMRMPADQLIDGVLVLIGGILLITPGIITDFIGLTLIFPLTRGFYRNYFKSKFANNFKTTSNFYIVVGL